MNWTLIISELIDAGYTQQNIANLCGSKQTTVSDLYRGATKEPGHSLGEEILKLHKSIVKEAA